MQQQLADGLAWFWSEIQPYVTAAIAAVGALALAWVRAKAQRFFAVEAATHAENWAAEFQHAKPTGALKKSQAVARARERMPRVVRPLTPGGLDQLVERAVPEARRRVSRAPGES